MLLHGAAKIMAMKKEKVKVEEINID